MRAFNNDKQAVDERNTKRQNFLTTPRIEKPIQQAAALCGVDNSNFTMNATDHPAQQTITRHESKVLLPMDHAAFLQPCTIPTGQ